MELQLPLPPLEFGPAPALRVECEVRWARREGWRHPRLVMGVAFANLADTARRRIHHYIVTEFQQEYPDHEDPAQP